MAQSERNSHSINQGLNTTYLKGMIFLFSSEKIISRYRRIGYKLNAMRQSACLDFNPIMVDNYAVFFNCTPVDRDGPDIKLFILVGLDRTFLSVAWPTGLRVSVTNSVPRVLVFDSSGWLS